MAKGPFKSYEIGKYPRFYDDLSEKVNEDESAEMGEVLAWLEEDPSGPRSKKSKREFIKKLVKSGMHFSDNEALNVLKPSGSGFGFSFSFFDYLYDTVKDIYYAGKDILAGKKVKTSLTIGAGIAVGAGAGFAIGTFLMPVVGSAIGGLGGAVAGFLTGAIGYLGGTIGMTVLGAAAGSWIGSKIGKKIFKHETRFQISKRKTKAIRRQLGIDSETAELINGYLYNRSKAMKSPLGKKYYDYLRKLIVQKPEKMGLKKAADFFMHELGLLERQRRLDGSTPGLDKEIESIVYILKKLAEPETRGMTLTFKNKIKAAYEAAENKTPTASTRVGQERTREVDVSTFQPSQRFNTMEQHFQEGLAQRQCKAKRVEATAEKGDYRCRYKIYGVDEREIADIDVHQTELDGKVRAEFMVQKEIFERGNKGQISELLVLEAQAYFKSTGNTSPTVFADGDDTLAVHLLAAAIKAGLSPRLDDEEYPENTTEAKARKIQVMEQAYRYAGRTPPETPRRVGFRAEH